MNQLRAGVLLSYLSIFISIVIALVYTPFMIRILGQSEYGLYSLIGSIAAYFSVMDMGLGNAIVRYTSRNNAIGDKANEAKLNGLFLLLYSIIGIITVLIGIIAFNSIDTIFSGNLSELELQKAKIMIIILTINFALSFPLSIFSSIIRAYERFVVDKLVSITRIILSPLLILPIILMGYGAISMVIITTVVNLSCLTFNVFYSFRKLHIKFHFGKIDTNLLKEILAYSLLVFLGVLVDQIYWQTDQIILGAVRGTIPVAIYAIGMQFVNLYIQFSTSISGLLLPKASKMVAKQASSEELTNMMIKFGRIQYAILAYILIGFILVGQPFISFWAGENYNQAYYIVLIIMIPLTIPLIQNTGISILYAKNLQGFRSVVLIFIALLNIVISIPLAKIYGGIGTAVATAVSLTLGNSIIMNIYYHKKIGINISLFWKNILLMTFPMIISFTIGALINYFVISYNIGIILLKIIGFSIVYILMMWKFSLTDKEKEIFISIVNRVRF